MMRDFFVENESTRNALEKSGDLSRTTPAQEYATQYLHGLNPFGIAANISGIIKAIKDPPQENAAKSSKDNLMPSVGSYRMVSRIKSQAYAQDAKHHGHAKDNYLSELLGSFTSGATPTILGGLAGAYLTRDKLMNSNLPFSDRILGTGKGVGIGIAIATAANLIGMLGSTITKRRSEMEQVKHDARRHWEDWLIPGPAMYNKGKRLGRSEGDYEEHPEKHKKIEEDLKQQKNSETPLKKVLKAVAMVAGIGMAGYGLYKIPSIIKSRKKSIENLADFSGE